MENELTVIRPKMAAPIKMDEAPSSSESAAESAADFDVDAPTTAAAADLGSPGKSASTN